MAYMKLMTFSILVLGVAIAYFGNVEEILQYISKWPLGQSVAIYVYKISSYIYTEVKQEPVKKKKSSKVEKIKVFTPEILKLYDGSPDSKGLYLGILGLVYDVKKGKSYYGPDGSYSFFAAKDGSRAFVSGIFTDEGLTDDVTGLSKQDYIGLNEWVNFYEKDYKFVGKLSGRFFDKNGNPTEYNLQVQKWIEDALSHKDGEDQEKQLFPPCNTEWTKETGSRLWCTKKSGGIARDWVGVPRKMYAPGGQSVRCACVRNTGPPSYDMEAKTHNNNGDLDHPAFEEYGGCDPLKSSCQVKLS